VRLHINSGEGFDDVRHHTLNYILQQGEIAIRSPLAEGRNRPPVNEEEFATVMFDNGFYSFYVEPVQKGKSRNMQIVIWSIDKETLEQKTSELMENTKLKRE